MQLQFPKTELSMHNGHLRYQLETAMHPIIHHQYWWALHLSQCGTDDQDQYLGVLVSQLFRNQIPKREVASDRSSPPTQAY